MKVTLLAYMQPNPDYMHEHDWNVEVESKPEWIATALMRSTRTIKRVSEILNDTNEEEVAKRIWQSVEWGHFTVAGMTDFIFVIEGVSRSLTHQLVRHRTAWFLQQSSRATDPSKQGFVLPKTARDNWSAHNEIDYFYTQARKTYKKLRDMGIPKEDARFVLPQGTSQRIVMKIDGSNLLHFFKLRLDEHAQWEIRELAERMHAAVVKVCPNLFDRKLEEYWW